MHEATRRNRLLIFAKCPQAGKVKTRLIPHVGVEAATRLYLRLLEHTLGRVQQYRGAAAELWLDPATQAPGCRKLLARYAFTAYPQCEGDLGRRMHWALDRALQHADKAVLIGSDCPDIDGEVLSAAFVALDQADAVFAPAVDGGYVLIGVRKTDPQLFDGVPWSSARVMVETRRRLERLGWSWQELPPLQDIDDQDDLAHPFVRVIFG